MKKSLAHFIETSLRSFLSYKRLVEISNRLNFPFVPPLTSSVQITLRCNSRCSYCDIWKLGKKRENCGVMCLDTLDKVFSSLRKLGVKATSLTGGEPLTRKDLNDVICSADHYGLSVDICTNGISLTKDRARELAETGVQCIILSLDTFDSEVYQKLRGVPFKFAKRALTSLFYITNEYPSVHTTVNCVITRHNIGTLVRFVSQVSEYGKEKISIILQPYHRPPTFSEISRGLDPEMRKKLLECYQDISPEELIPNHECKPIFEKEIEELVHLKEKGFPLKNSESYLRMIPDFLFDNKLPKDFNCLAGYSSVVIRYDLKVLPCWRLSPVGDLHKEELTDIWFSRRYAERRKNIKRLRCQGCMLVCHNEPSFYEFYDLIYKSQGSQGY